ncbi:MAG: HAD-IIIA family hydrolase, partial [Bdellovibrionales bacterium]|nr:HAD-IIIA family hydrolase [Bdellovibrionales bacterium]
KKLLLIDRDGTINVRPKVGHYVATPEQLFVKEDAIRGMKSLAEAGYEFLVVTNQAGIATGEISATNLRLIHERLRSELLQHGIQVRHIYCSTDHWKSTDSPRRKPNPGMFFEASREHNLRLDATYYIGDDPRDMIAAYNAATPGVYVGDPEALEKLPPRYRPQFVGTNLEEVASFILDRQ